MKSKLILLLLILSLPITGFTKDLTLTNAPMQVYFSPRGGCTEAIVAALNKAKSEVLVQAYSFTSRDIAKSLVDAHKRGVHVEIILDKSIRNHKGNYSSADFTAHMGIPTFIDAEHAIAHNKTMIIDEDIVVTGSFNFTKAAEYNNAENLIVIQSKDLAKIYRDNWFMHRGHSSTYEGR